MIIIAEVVFNITQVSVKTISKLKYFICKGIDFITVFTDSGIFKNKNDAF